MKKHIICIAMAHICRNINSKFSKRARDIKDIVWQANIKQKVPKTGSYDIACLWSKYFVKAVIQTLTFYILDCAATY